MDLALKYAQKAERFILCTIILGFLFLIVIIAIIEAAVKSDNDWAHKRWTYTGVGQAVINATMKYSFDVLIVMLFFKGLGPLRDQACTVSLNLNTSYRATSITLHITV